MISTKSFFLICPLLLAGCSDDSMPNMNMNTGGTDAGSDASDTPSITAVSKMQGVLHVQWTNPATACGSVEGERKAEMANGSIMEPYKVVFTVPGTVDNKMDPGATENMKYTYRLRCQGATKYSGEMSGNPKQ